MRTLALAAAAVALVGCSTSAPVAPPPVLPEPSPTPAVPQVGALRISAIAVDTNLVGLGLNAAGGHEVPPLERSEVAGWYTLGVAPGDPGPAIVLGHVSGGGKPGVFAELDKLHDGDLVSVERNGQLVTFTVYDVLRVDKDAFPAELVYGDTVSPELRLITCGGALDRSVGHYEDNVIVFAKAVAP